jgi:polygalacturonase
MAAARLLAAGFTANVLSYGGRGDGKFLNTAAINNAMNAIASQRGGTLYFPPGIFLSGPFNLTSNLVLLLDAATLVADPDIASWPLIAPLPSYGQGRDHTNITWERYGPFIGGYNVTNIAITTNSTGVIHASGAPWWAAHNAGLLCCTPPHLFESAFTNGVEIGAAPGSPPQSLILLNSPFWNVHLYAGNSHWVHDVTILADPLQGNTDGVDPDSAQDVLIERVTYVGGDDGVAVKSGWDQAGIDFNMPTRNVTVRDSSFSTRSSCVCIGSEMSGGVEDVLVQNVNCTGTGTGFYVKSAPGRGGYVRNYTMTDVRMNGVGIGIQLSVDYGDHPDGKPVNTSALPVLDGFTVARVSGRGMGLSGSLLGLADAAFTNVSITDVNFEASGGWVCGNVSGTSANVFPAPCAEIGG